MLKFTNKFTVIKCKKGSWGPHFVSNKGINQSVSKKLNKLMQEGKSKARSNIFWEILSAFSLELTIGIPGTGFKVGQLI